MHQATIGLVGHHIVPSIIYKIRKLLRNDLYTKGLTAEGNPRYLISEAMLDEVFTRLCRRLQEYQSSYAGFQLTPKYTAHFKRVFLEGRSTFTASRLELLMIALPSVLRDLILQEIELSAGVRIRILSEKFVAGKGSGSHTHCALVVKRSDC